MFRLGFYCTLSCNKQYSIGFLHFYVMFFHYIIHGKLPWFTSHSGLGGMVCVFSHIFPWLISISGVLGSLCIQIECGSWFQSFHILHIIYVLQSSLFYSSR